MIWSILAEEKSSVSNYLFPAILVVLVVLLIVWFFFSNRKNKQHQKEYVEQLDAIRPGNKVKTAGGICGIVVEVCDDNTVIIETGSENAGKSYVKMDKELIAQTDAKGPTQIAREKAEAQRRADKEARAQGKKSHQKPEETEPAEPAEPAAEDAERETVPETAEAPEEKPEEKSEKDA